MKKSETLIKPQIEKVLKQVILKDLDKGRKNFDLPHTKAVVYWMKHLLQNIDFEKTIADEKKSISRTKIDPQVLITAAYAHDWGYIGLFANSNPNSFADIAKMKKLHMTRGSIMIERLIHQRLGRYFTQNQILRVAHLVLFHDKMEDLVDEDEILLMEADTLGMLDPDRVTPTFSKADNDQFLKKSIRGRRLPRFIHKEAKNIALEMLEKRKKFYD